MNYRLEIQKILLSVDKATDNKDRLKLIKQAITIADSNNDIDWGFDLREELLYLEKGTSTTQESFPAFVWMLHNFDSNPELLPIDELLQKYRWMILATHRNANFSLEQIESIREDYLKRMTDRGHGSFTYYNTICQWYIQLGDVEQARKYQTLRDKEQPDNISYCKACVINTDVQLELLTKNFDKAISIAEEVISNKETCYYEPLSVLSKLCYYLELDKDIRAKDFYQKAIDAYTGITECESHLMEDLSRLIFYGSVHDKETAWGIFKRVSEWDLDADDYPSYYFALNILPLFKPKQDIELNLNLRLPYANNDGVYNTSDLYAFYLDKAQKLASKFDLRNQNDYCMQCLERVQNF